MSDYDEVFIVIDAHISDPDDSSDNNNTDDNNKTQHHHHQHQQQQQQLDSKTFFSRAEMMKNYLLVPHHRTGRTCSDSDAELNGRKHSRQDNNRLRKRSLSSSDIETLKSSMVAKGRNPLSRSYSKDSNVSSSTPGLLSRIRKLSSETRSKFSSSNESLEVDGLMRRKSLSSCEINTEGKNTTTEENRTRGGEPTRKWSLKRLQSVPNSSKYK